MRPTTERRIAWVPLAERHNRHLPPNAYNVFASLLSMQIAFCREQTSIRIAATLLNDIIRLIETLGKCLDRRSTLEICCLVTVA